MKRGKNNDAKRRSTARATVPGVVHESHTDTTQEPDTTSIQSNHGVASASASSNIQQVNSTVAARSTTTTSPNNGSFSKSPRRTAPATTPGAVAVSKEENLEPTSPNAAYNNLSSASLSSARENNISSGKIRRTTSATQPGAVRVTSEGEEKVEEEPMEAVTTRSGHGTTTATTPPVQGVNSTRSLGSATSSSPGPSNGKTRRTVAATRPGAVRVSNDGVAEEPQEVAISDSFRITGNNQNPTTAAAAAAGTGKAKTTGLSSNSLLSSTLSEQSLMSSSSSIGAGFNKPSRGVAAIRPGAVSVIPGKSEEPLSPGSPEGHSSRLRQMEREDDDGASKPARSSNGLVEAVAEGPRNKGSRNTGTMTPGAVAVSNSSSLPPPPDFMAAVEQDVVDMKSRNKSTRNTGTVTPGAVAVSGSAAAEATPAILSTVERDLESKGGRKSGRNMGAMTPGAVAVSGAAASAATVESRETPAVLSTVERDLESKNRKSARNMGAMTPGAVSVSGSSTAAAGPPVTHDEVTPAVLSTVERDLESKNRKSARNMGAMTPGAVAVSASASVDTSDQTDTPAILSAAERDLESKNRKSSRNVGAMTPGAVAVSSSRTTTPTAEQTDTPAILASVERDLESKNRKSARNVGALTPGAVSVSIAEEPNASLTPAVLTAVDRDLESKKGKSGRNMGASTPGAVPMSDANDDESISDSRRSVVRFSEEDALAKPGSKSRLGRRPTTPGAESVSVKEAEEFDAAVSKKDPRSAALAERRRNASEKSLSSQSDDSARNIDRMEAKILRMEREEEARALRRETAAAVAATTAITAPAPISTTPTPPLSQVVDSEKSSYPAENVKSLDPAEDLEKYANPAEDDSKVIEADVYPSDVKDAAVTVAPSTALMGGITSTADRGVSVAPDVVRGSTTLNAYAPGETEGLVVAIAISEEDEDDGVLRVYGTEYDPDAKPPLYTNRRVRLYAILACVLLVAIVGGTLGAVLGTSTESVTVFSATPAPLPSQDMQYYRLFADAVGNQLVFEPDTPHQLAAEWIIHTDPMKLPVQSDHVIQRYLLALFYFQMSNNGRSSWRSCNPPPEGQNDTCIFLNRVSEPVVLQNGTAFDNVTFDPMTINPQTGVEYNRWLSGAHECLWAGNLCDSNNLLRSMELFAQNLTGTLPTEIGAISFLQSFSVPFNFIEGTIPTVYANLRHLVQLELHYNMLTGTFSDIWYQSTGLLSLNLGGNMISGSFTSELGLLSNLKGLFMFENHFVGTIPTELGKLSYLSFTRWNDNPFEGTIPTEIGSLTFLEELFLYDTLLTGTIPSEIGLLTQLTDLRMNDNKLNGTIPEQLYNLNKLANDLDFSDMSLTGTLSTRIGNLTSLNVLKLRRNKLAGTVPSELALLTKLQLVWLHLNDFTGPIPDQICQNRGKAVDYKLEYLQADCGPAGNPTQSCQCCTACCDRSNNLCLIQ